MKVIVENPELVDADDEKSSGWADVMAKVLVKQGPKDAETVILGKKADAGGDEEDEETEKLDWKRRLNKKRKWETMNYSKPSVLEKDYERSLQKVATRGVVQLFNAVKKHQKQLEEKLNSVKTESKKEKVVRDVDKGKFLDMLKGDIGGAAAKNIDEEEE
uniref:RRP15-like protein n=1 Tax=Ciona savignyi TaxID=51511 RepID=H2YQR9_CIOSA